LRCPSIRCGIDIQAPRTHGNCKEDPRSRRQEGRQGRCAGQDHQGSGQGCEGSGQGRQGQGSGRRARRCEADQDGFQQVQPDRPHRRAGVEAKVVKSVLAALESSILASVHKKGLGEFTLPGLLKVVVQNVPAKKKRMGKDPFTGVERMFAAKPASVKIKTRALKKLKDAAL
jgi:hypothetical protein